MSTEAQAEKSTGSTGESTASGEKSKRSTGEKRAEEKHVLDARSAPAPRPPLQPRPVISRRAKLRLAIAGAVLAGLVALVLLAVRNHRRFFLCCAEDSLRAERGRRFPFGRSQLEGQAYTPVALSPEIDCHGRELPSLAALDEALGKLLLDRLQRALGRPDAEVDVAQAEGWLRQVLLLTRGLPERPPALARLSGDLAVLRGKAALWRAAGELREAGKQFRQAASQQPLTRGDPAPWQRHAEELARRVAAPPPAEMSEGPAAGAIGQAAGAAGASSTAGTAGASGATGGSGALAPPQDTVMGVAPATPVPNATPPTATAPMPAHGPAPATATSPALPPAVTGSPPGRVPQAGAATVAPDGGPPSGGILM